MILHGGEVLVAIKFHKTLCAASTSSEIEGDLEMFKPESALF